NISEGGLCCLTTSCPPESTREVCIFASLDEAEMRIPLKVRWSMPAGTEYFIGCQFVRSTDFAVLRKLQSLHSDAACTVAPSTAVSELHDAGAVARA
ncbi:MAG TPA: PilZ domain-containing protein, partial [Pirellulales bacterium]|nr:PilZ domain-containing protein [Pirellulales bacterium]